MFIKKETTLRLNLPQWQGGNRHDYYIGSHLLAWLAPPANGPFETIPEPTPGETLAVENGIVARATLLRQARAARQAIESNRTDNDECFSQEVFSCSDHRRYRHRLSEMYYDGQRPHQSLDDASPLTVFRREYPFHAAGMGALTF